MGYLTLAGPGEHEDVVKGSRFVASATPLAHVDDAEAFVTARRAADPDASHHVWAWRYGEALRWSDDGEPAGSAGRPVAEVLLKRGLDRAAVVVTRTFGGTKLGVGGLVRAYGAAAARALDAAGTRTVAARQRWRVRVPYGSVDALLRAASDDEAVLSCHSEYDANGALVVLELLDVAAEAWRRQLADLTRGDATLLERVLLDADPTGVDQRK